MEENARHIVLQCQVKENMREAKLNEIRNIVARIWIVVLETSLLMSRTFFMVNVLENSHITT